MTLLSWRGQWKADKSTVLSKAAGTEGNTKSPLLCFLATLNPVHESGSRPSRFDDMVNAVFAAPEAK